MKMECKNCSYGKEDFNRRIALYNKIIEEQGIPNDIYDYRTYEDAVKDAEQFLWCDKVGGKVYCFGHCIDAYSAMPTHKNHSKIKRKNKRERDLKYKNHLKHLYKCCNSYPPPVIYMDEIWIKGYGYIENLKPYYKRLYRGNHKSNRYKYYKKYANHCVRKYKEELHKGNSYKKVFDYWWAVN